MARPTASSAAKVHEKVKEEAKSPPRKPSMHFVKPKRKSEGGDVPPVPKVPGTEEKDVASKREESGAGEAVEQTRGGVNGVVADGGERVNGQGETAVSL
jgi:hypothetical protein